MTLHKQATTEVTRYLGIDLSAQPARTACCVIERRGTKHSVLSVDGPCHDEGLLSEMRAADVVAIDAPFGWPTTFVAAMSNLASESWPPQVPNGSGNQARAAYDYSALRLRETDRYVSEQVRKPDGKPLRPLSVSADSIGVVAFRAAALLNELAKAPGWEFDRTGGAEAITGKRVFEVYPAATLAVYWGDLKSGDTIPYKKTSDQSRTERKRLVPLLAKAAGLSIADPDERTDAITRNEHRFDAYVAAITGILASDGRTHSPEDHQLAADEGWIHFPKTSGVEIPVRES